MPADERHRQQPGGQLRTWPLVGRERELNALVEVIEEVPPTGAVIIGEAGLGKTRLAEEALGRARLAGRQCLRVFGSRAVADLPLCALAAVLPVDLGGSQAPTSLVAAALRALAEAYSARPALLYIDDAQWLDHASAYVVQQAAMTGLLTVVATVRAGHPGSAAVLALWKDRPLRRIDVGPLSDAEVAELIGGTLGESVAVGTRLRMIRLVAGNPLFLRELLRGGLDGGLLTQVDGVWHLASSVLKAPGLVELLEVRLADIDGAERTAMELLAVADEIGLTVLHALVGQSTVESLERRGLLAVRYDGRRVTVHLGHPLYGELLRASMPVTATMRYSAVLAESLEKVGVRRSTDLMRWAIWRTAGGGPVDPGLIRLATVRAAMLRADPVVRERLARHAWESDPGMEIGTLLCQALFELGRYGEAGQLLEQLSVRPGTDRDHAQVALARAWYVGFGLGDVRAGLAALGVARRKISDDCWLAELTAQEGALLATAGEPERARQLLEPLLSAAWSQVRGRATIGAAMAFLLCGRFPEGERAVARALDAHRETGDHPAFAPSGGLPALRIRFLSEGGDPAAACELGRQGVESATLSADVRGGAWTAMALASAELAAGRLTAAGIHAVEAAAVFGSAQHPWAQGWCLAVALTAAVQQRAAARADELATRLRTVDPDSCQVQLFHFELDRARAWHASIGMSLGEARRMSVQCARRWRARGATTPVVLVAHDLVRFGDPASALEQLELTEIPPQWRLGAVLADHIRAAAAGDPDALERVAESFADLGLPLHAAEAASQCAALLARHEPRAAARLRARSRALAARCEGADTPLLAGSRALARLTGREQQIAELAARRLSDREIAERLVLSVRTVENHLSRAYAKLGIDGRDGLVNALRG